MGLLLLGIASGPAVVINLGSHWKAIQIDAAGRISGSISSLAGEMIHAVQTTTILASAVPGERPAELDLDWLAEGMKQQRTAGLARAMFCVRLLEQANQSTPQQRFAYLIGAFIAADLDALMATKKIDPQSRILLAGNKMLTHAWRAALASAGVNGLVLSEEQVEQAMIAGLVGIFGEARRAE
jgi:2-dehydro-3-deoxygalactonokinase